MGLVTRIVLVLLVPILAAGGTEEGFRLFSPWPGNWVTYEQRDGYLYFHVPNSHGWETSAVGEFPPVRLDYNQYGLRGTDQFPLRPEAGERRILVLADSYLEAREVSDQDTLARRLERMLQTTTKNRVRVLNAGLSGTSSIPEYIYLNDEGLNLGPAAVILFFSFTNYTNNAVHTWLDYPDYAVSGLPDKLKPVEYAPGYVPPSRDLQLSRESAFYYYLYRQKLEQNTTKIERDPVPYYIQTKTLDLNAKGVFNSTYTPAEQSAIDLTNASILRMKQLCDRHGIPLYVVGIPWPHQVSGNEWNPGKMTWGYADGEMITSSKFPDVLTSYLTANGIPNYDLLPWLRQAEPDHHPLYLGYEGHWTVQGNDQAARGVFDFLREQPSFMSRLQ